MARECRLDNPRPVWKILAALLPAVLLPFLASLLYFVLYSQCQWARALYGATKLFTLLWPLAAVLLVLKEPLPRFGGGWRTHARALLPGALAGLIVAGAMVGLVATPLGAVVMESAGAIRTKALQLGILDHYWAFALFLSLVNSAVEEYYWRWFVYGQIRRLLPGWRAHALAGLAFSAHHAVVVSQFFPWVWVLPFALAVGLGGVIMSVLYERQGTLAGAWACHLLADLGIMRIGYWLLF